MNKTIEAIDYLKNRIEGEGEYEHKSKMHNALVIIFAELNKAKKQLLTIEQLLEGHKESETFCAQCLAIAHAKGELPPMASKEEVIENLTSLYERGQL